MSYTAPIKEMLFVMKELAGLEDIANMPGFEDANLDTAQAVLDESAKLCGEVLAPLNVDGDRNPSSWKDGIVTATPGFKDAFRQFAEGGWQGVQHPLAECWAYLESAWWMTLRAAALYDAKQPCGAEANASKLLGARAAFNACKTSIMTHGGMGYAREYQIERLFRESVIPVLAPVSEQMILSFIGENVLGLPKSY